MDEELITRLLSRWRDGDESALDELLPLVYEELRQVASRYLQRERSGHTLEPAALVHEVYLRLARSQSPDWQGRTHFYAVAARVMRRVLVEHARSRKTDRRGGNVVFVPLSDARVPVEGRSEVDVLVLSQALERLAEVDPVQSRIIELRFFSGLSLKETASFLGVSPASIVREARAARAWLYEQLGPQPC